MAAVMNLGANPPWTRSASSAVEVAPAGIGAWNLEARELEVGLASAPANSVSTISRSSVARISATPSKPGQLLRLEPAG